ncbi:MAG TPA: hypothetical protein PLG86_03700 [Bacteroidales bacterium]|nr:hypothetical protein [Bacteroidales bacterium]
MENKHFAVITGDIVGSSKLNGEQKRLMIEAVKTGFARVQEISGNEALLGYYFFRGDSFQGVLVNPKYALKAALAIKTALRTEFPHQRKKQALDARIAIGIGCVDNLSSEIPGTGNGEAFLLSGLTLDKMKPRQRLIIVTSNSAINSELVAECAMADAIISQWAIQSAEAVYLSLKGLTLEQIAESSGISPIAAHYRLEKAGFFAFMQWESRWMELLDLLSPGT